MSICSNYFTGMEERWYLPPLDPWTDPQIYLAASGDGTVAVYDGHQQAFVSADFAEDSDAADEELASCRAILGGHYELNPSLMRH